MDALDMAGNPSSVHSFGRASRAVIEAARRSVAMMVAARPAQVVFTSGGTEANAMAISGVGVACLIISAIEHDSVLAASAVVGPEVMRLRVDGSGVADLAALDAMLTRLHGPALVSLMLVNNETGVIQPVAEAAALVHQHGGLLHCDAVQAPGRLVLDRTTLGADIISLSAHKLGGPPGVGALVIDEALMLRPLLHGGGQERGRRAGTENLAGIAGFGRAAEMAAGDLLEMPRLAAWQGRMEREIRVFAPEVEVFGAQAARIATTCCLSLPGIPAETQVIALDLAGVAVSAGAACSSGKARNSHVLAAMGVNQLRSNCAIRISMGWATTERDIDRMIEAYRQCHRR